MKQPVISVITVVYNGAATLEATLESVVNQTWPAVEYVLIDGGSTDGTLELIDKYRSRIDVLVSEPDTGVYDAMNKGIRMAHGDWLFFLGSDDRLVNAGVFAAMFSDPARLDCDLLYGNVTSPSYKGWYDGPFSFAKLLSRNISHQAIFYRREGFGRTGDFNLRYRMHADWDLNIRWFTDASIKTKYAAVLVSEFGAEGISAGHDVLFLREVLVPEKLRWLDRHRQSLRAIKDYDEWWRLLRNAGIRDVSTLEQCARGEQIPPAIKRMIAWQQKLPPKLLQKGVISKSIMLIHYLSNF